MDQNAVTKAVYFTAGLLIGGGTAYLLVKKRYRLLAEEEIASVKDVFEKLTEEKARKLRDDWNPQGDDETKEEIALRKKYEDVVDHSGYSSATKEEPDSVTTVEVDIDEEHENVEIHFKSNERDPKKPYPIDMADYYNNGEYENISLTYWVPDNMLTDERDMQVEDVDAWVGIPNLLNLMNVGVEEIYIRNEKLEMDFEIHRDARSYNEAMGKS